MRAIVVLLGAVVLMLQARLWIGEEGIAGVYRVTQEITARHEEVAGLRLRNERLAAEVADLKRGLGGVEAQARRELGMIRRDETYYLFVDR